MPLDALPMYFTKWAKGAQMETAIQAQGVPWAVAEPRLVSGPGAQPSH